MNNWPCDSFLRKLGELLTKPTERHQRDIMDIPQKKMTFVRLFTSKTTEKYAAHNIYMQLNVYWVCVIVCVSTGLYGVQCNLET